MKAMDRSVIGRMTSPNLVMISLGIIPPNPFPVGSRPVIGTDGAGCHNSTDIDVWNPFEKDHEHFLKTAAPILTAVFVNGHRQR